MKLGLGNVIMFVITFSSLFAGLVVLGSGQSYTSYNPFPITSQTFASTNIQNTINGIIGSGSSYGAFYFLHVILSGLLYPFAFIYLIFISITSIFIWLGNFFAYPFSFFPYPLNIIMASIFSGLIVISIITSIKILSSGISNED